MKGQFTAIDISGERFGRLVAIERSPTPVGKPTWWVCQCDCGGKKVARTGALRGGVVSSCGCLRTERGLVQSAINTTHGCTNMGGKATPEYSCWTNMRHRISNPKSPVYKYYGGRGIRICERWQISFENFLADMGKRPSPSHSIERRDNNGDYCPENCYWASKKEQVRNRRTSRQVEYEGVTRSVSELSKLKGINYRTLLHRLVDLNLPVKQAMETPARRLSK